MKTHFNHDRSKSVGSSEVGKCLRQIVYAKTGIVPDVPDPGVSGFTVRGDIIENHWAAPLVRAWAGKWGGEALYSGQNEQITLKGNKVPMSATPDSVCVGVDRGCLAEYGVPDIGASKCVVIEMKSFDPRIAADKLPKDVHVLQIRAQMGLIRAALPHKPDFGAIMYVNASDLFDIRVYPFAHDEKMFKSLVKRSDFAMKARNPDAVMPEGKARGGCNECPWSKTCLGYVPFSADDPRALSAKEVESVEKLAEKVKKLERQEEETKRLRLEAEGDLHLKLGEVKKRFVQGKMFKVIKKDTPSQMRNDVKKLVELAKSLGATDAQLSAVKSPTKAGVTIAVEIVS